MESQPSPPESDSSDDSLFGSASSTRSPSPGPHVVELNAPVTSLHPPTIPGLHLFPSMLPSELTSLLVNSIANSNLFLGGARDQVMLFGVQALPGWMSTALVKVRETLKGVSDERLLEDVFDDRGRGRQVIMNLYKPGQGITPHIDLPHRYDTPILSVSLLSGTSFLLRRRKDTPSHPPDPASWEKHRFWVPERSIMILDGEARWDWEHGIEAREGDYVEDPDADGGRPVWRGRGTRVSLTFRWMKPGAEVVGGELGASSREETEHA